MIDKRFSIIKKYIKDKKVLDIGCVQHDISNIDNDSWLHGFIRKHAKDVVGIDIEKEGVNYLKNKGLDVRYEDAQDFDLDEKFDVIVAGEIIEHLSNFEGFIKSMKKHMKDNSRIIITTPNPFFIRRFIDILLFGKLKARNEEHTCWLDEQSLRELMRRYDLRNEDTFFVVGGKARYANKINKILPLSDKFTKRTMVSIWEAGEQTI